MTKIGIDFHGVLDTYTDFFMGVSEMAKKHGMEIHVITGTPFSRLEDWFVKRDFFYTHFYSITDDFLARGYEHKYINGAGPFFADYWWYKAKADYCLENGIDLMYDNDMRYLSLFQTPYILVGKDEK